MEYISAYGKIKSDLNPKDYIALNEIVFKLEFLGFEDARIKGFLQRLHKALRENDNNLGYVIAKLDKNRFKRNERILMWFSGRYYAMMLIALKEIKMDELTKKIKGGEIDEIRY